MAQRNPLHRLADLAPTPFDALVEHGASAIDDIASLPSIIGSGLPGNDIDDWDPEHIRSTLPLSRAFVRTYFRGEVRGMREHPRRARRCSWATTPAAR